MKEASQILEGNSPSSVDPWDSDKQSEMWSCQSILWKAGYVTHMNKEKKTEQLEAHYR